MSTPKSWFFFLGADNLNNFKILATQDKTLDGYHFFKPTYKNYQKLLENVLATQGLAKRAKKRRSS